MTEIGELKIKIKADTSEIDGAIEKVMKLRELLDEACGKQKTFYGDPQVQSLIRRLNEEILAGSKLSE